tara:strand:- start:416 stop:865 length:450 start_codon:yes stop_codon:yes gene_type:complete
MKNPKWIFKTPPISISLSNEIASILRMTTGEELVGERISILPLAENGIILLQENDQVLGSLLWMKINQLTARVLGFGIHPELQGKNLGSECWEILIKEITQQNMNKITLEVRESNERAIKFYRKKGLKPKGWIEDYYKNEKGILMEIDL